MFKAALETILERTEGSLGALIMGTDGIAVEKRLTAEGSELNLDVAAAELTSLVRLAQRTGADVGRGSLRDIVLTYETCGFVVRMISDEYFLVLALSPDALPGRGRYELRRVEFDLAGEFVL